MLNNLSLKFQWPSYLVKFLMSEYGNKLEINGDKYCFRLLIGTKKPAYNEYEKPKLAKFNLMEYSIEVPKYYIDKTDISYIKNVGAIHFIQFIDGQFKELMITYVDAQLSLKRQIKEQAVKKKIKGIDSISGLSMKNSIIEFCSKFSIDETDVKLETLIKHTQRHLSDCKTHAA